MILCTTGVLAGILSGVFGLGGGVILVPAFYYVFTFMGYGEYIAMHMAVGSALACSVPATLAAFQSHYHKENVDVSLLKSWGPTILIGVLLGAYLGTLLEGLILLKIFSIYLVFAALAMFRSNETKPLFDDLPNEPWRGISGVTIGSIASLLGIGGGTITVPKMALFGKPMKEAVGTASALSALVCFSGTISHIIVGMAGGASYDYSIGHVNWLAFLIVAPIGIAAAKGGARLADHMNPNHLRWIFASFMIFVSGKMMIDAFGISL